MVNRADDIADQNRYAVGPPGPMKKSSPARSPTGHNYWSRCSSTSCSSAARIQFTVSQFNATSSLVSTSSLSSRLSFGGGVGDASLFPHSWRPARPGLPPVLHPYLMRSPCSVGDSPDLSRPSQHPSISSGSRYSSPIALPCPTPGGAQTFSHRSSLHNHSIQP